MTDGILTSINTKDKLYIFIQTATEDEHLYTRLKSEFKLLIVLFYVEILGKKNECIILEYLICINMILKHMVCYKLNIQ